MSEPSTRSRSARTRAERAFGLLLDAVGDRWEELVLIGGLLPERLVHEVEAHQGTTDIDVVLDLALVFDRDEQDFGWLEHALATAGFLQEQPNTGWRWVVDIDGFPVRLDFLIDVPDNNGQELALPGASVLGAMNVLGPRAALAATQRVEILGRSALIAGIGGYLAAKGSAILGRQLPKDLYDFAFVIVYAPKEENVARAVAEIALRHDDLGINGIVRAACALYVGVESEGATTYAAQAFEMNPAEAREIHALDAVVAVRTFLARFEEYLGIERRS